MYYSFIDSFENHMNKKISLIPNIRSNKENGSLNRIYMSPNFNINYYIKSNNLIVTSLSNYKRLLRVKKYYDQTIIFKVN